MGLGPQFPAERRERRRIIGARRPVEIGAGAARAAQGVIGEPGIPGVGISEPRAAAGGIVLIGDGVGAVMRLRGKPPGPVIGVGEGDAVVASRACNNKLQEMLNYHPEILSAGYRVYDIIAKFYSNYAIAGKHKESLSKIVEPPSIGILDTARWNIIARTHVSRLAGLASRCRASTICELDRALQRLCAAHAHPKVLRP